MQLRKIEDDLSLMFTQKSLGRLSSMTEFENQCLIKDLKTLEDKQQAIAAETKSLMALKRMNSQQIKIEYSTSMRKATDVVS